MRPYIDYQHDHLAARRLLFAPATRTQRAVRGTLLRMRWAPALGPAFGHLMAVSSETKMKRFDVAAV